MPEGRGDANDRHPMAPRPSALVRNAATIVIVLALVGLMRFVPLGENAWAVAVVVVLGCAWFGGLGPSVIAPLLLILLLRLIHEGPAHVFAFSVKELIDVGVFFLLTVVVGWSGHVRRRALVVVHRQASELREEARSKDRFLATLAHELRNPLAPMRTGLQVLQRTAPAADPAAVREVHEMMQRQIDHLVRLIDDLLDVSRINTGKIELRRERVALDVVIRDAIDAARPHLDAARHRFTAHVPDERLEIIADRVRLSQVLQNLLHNAAKFTKPGGRISLSACRAGDAAEIVVSDSGIGIPPDMLPRIFDLFTQVDSSIERSHGGLGIGLSLVKTLVELHGGTVQARSDGPGRGSELVLRLPIADDQPAGQPTDSNTVAAANNVPGGRRILIVDDNEDAARSLAMLLRHNRHECRVALNGPEAIEIAPQFTPQAVILDIGMPEMSGYEVIGRLRSLPELHQATFIAVSGWGQDDDRRRSSEAGFDHHLIKPVEVQALQDILVRSRNGN